MDGGEGQQDSLRKRNGTDLSLELERTLLEYAIERQYDMDSWWWLRKGISLQLYFGMHKGTPIVEGINCRESPRQVESVYQVDWNTGFLPVGQRRECFENLILHVAQILALRQTKGEQARAKEGNEVAVSQLAEYPSTRGRISPCSIRGPRKNHLLLHLLKARKWDI